MSGYGAPLPSTYTPARYAESRPLTTSRTEVLHILVAYTVLTFDIAIVTSALQLFSFASGRFNTEAFLTALPYAAVIALTGFLVHELAHKITAQRLGFWSEFRASPVGLVVSVLTAIAGFLLAAPGATLIGGQGTVRDWGRSALAGPAVNLVEALVFLAAAFASVSAGASVGLSSLLFTFAFFDGWFAAFNLVPIGPLDGRKVLSWNPLIWGGTFAAAAIVTAVAFFI